MLTLDLGGGVTMDLVRIPHGTFQMGLPDSDKDADGDEKPRHAVTIMNDFYLGKYLVTKEQFAQFVAVQGASYKTEGEDGDGGWGFEGTKFKQDRKYSWRDPGFGQTDQHPVVNVTWNDAARFCEWAGTATKRGVQLPTEAQWEYACRGGTTTCYFTGDGAESLEGSANIADASFKGKYPSASWAVAWDDTHAFTSPVGKFRPNPFGLYDMAGNVYEWCSDYYDPKFYNNSPKEDPENLTKSAARVLRGGSFSIEPRNCRAASRDWTAPAYRRSGCGFRVSVRLD